ncbi:MAG TPA: DUF3168 domain-containing protein [Paracoccus sp. (in: a-proteobacteria)]|uniref:DUF3168 domain-containing protein n=1 Tax=Paracoccus sp. TaxID=267 RepID=UPI002C90BB36|nr:DUF3168 domain-containing protein [Paracoccus sp. (in: a-proteobacteria)]HWL56410.1 DUF3168 domain-containing protein [Paracoccus sp. (in: a-proteobacteria)]
MNIDLEVQKAIRARLTTYAVGVPAAQIVDANQRPSTLPAILLGDSQALDEGTSLRRAHTRVYHTLHVWKKEPSLEGVKTIAGAIRSAVRSARLVLAPGLHCADTLVSSMRFLRDPDGEHSHGVVVVEVLVSEAVA